uniref:Uncharacterized protein n=1 Tax=Wuchereria bancrofti TaxID=6293 RepID=A0AAF5Q076_WUCBA
TKQRKIYFQITKNSSSLSRLFHPRCDPHVLSIEQDPWNNLVRFGLATTGKGRSETYKCLHPANQFVFMCLGHPSEWVLQY